MRGRTRGARKPLLIGLLVAYLVAVGFVAGAWLPAFLLALVLLVTAAALMCAEKPRKGLAAALALAGVALGWGRRPAEP